MRVLRRLLFPQICDPISLTCPCQWPTLLEGTTQNRAETGPEAHQAPTRALAADSHRAMSCPAPTPKYTVVMRQAMMAKRTGVPAGSGPSRPSSRLVEVHHEADSKVVEHRDGRVDDHQESEVPHPVDVAEGQVAVDGHVKQGDLDNAHDHQHWKRIRTGRHTGQGHHEDEHGTARKGSRLARPPRDSSV